MAKARHGSERTHEPQPITWRSNPPTRSIQNGGTRPLWERQAGNSGRMPIGSRTVICRYGIRMVVTVAMFCLLPFQSIRAGSIPASDFLGGKYLPTAGAFRFLQSRPARCRAGYMPRVVSVRLMEGASHARYIKCFKVRFLDADSSLWSTATRRSGGSAWAGNVACPGSNSAWR